MMSALAAGDYHARTSRTGRDLAGRTLGIIGFGRIGRRVGEIAHQGFGMHVLYHDIVAAPPEAEARAGATRVGFDELLASLRVRHPPRPARRQHPADDRPRGAGQDAARRDPDQHLPAARSSTRRPWPRPSTRKRLWGYGGDVFEDEPPRPDHPLIGRPDVMLTPHSAAQTVEGLRNMATWIAEDVLGVLRGEPPRNPVNDPAEVAEARLRRLGKPPASPAG